MFSLLNFLYIAQPDNPSDLGNKIYEMMAIALGGRWGRAEDDASEAEADGGEEGVVTESASEETAEAEVVEPSEIRAENDPWKD